MEIECRDPVSHLHPEFSLPVEPGRFNGRPPAVSLPATLPYANPGTTYNEAVLRPVIATARVAGGARATILHLTIRIRDLS